jgi:penicillin-binding protein 1A
MVAAVTATEDRRFYHHWGVDPKGIIRALWRNRQAGRLVQGGSTITQQVAKVLFLQPDRTYRRKVEEVLLALSLEYRLQKNQILELYLNRIYFGAGNYGVEAAAQHYFGKGVGKLTLYECAILAGLIKSPNYYAPTTDMPRALERGKTVLNIMLEIGSVTRPEYDAALANPPTLRAYLPSESYGFVIDWVLQQIAELGLNAQEDQVVETTIDYELQGVAQKIVTDNMDQHGAEFDAGEASAVIMEPSGAIKALIGGRDYTKKQYNRAVQGKRQPGSTFKPFVWLAALEKGLTPDSKVRDAPIQIGDWSPNNYDNRYHGDVTLRDGLAHSMNTVSVRLSEWVGRDTVVKTAHRMGISSPLHKIPSIALGTSEVSLLEITAAYLPFANGGFSAQPHIIKSVRDARGEYTFKHGRTNWGQIIEPQHVGAMNSMLMATIEIGTGHQASLEPHQAAGKTGTTQSYRDAWFLGFTSYYVTGVWIGNDDGKPMKRVTGGGLPTQIWRDLMLYAHVGKQPAALPGVAEYQHQASNGGAGSGDRTFFDDLFNAPASQPTLDQPAETGSTRSKPKRKSWLERQFE